mmetsp:Transcript_43302/g.115851  ORF Transcript_43302/g.115851 Transcript_43302/m.115851 type:complete len:158 (-) Transcript_43302:242-715(-)
MRPWATDFLAPTRFTKPNDDWTQRMKTNVAYYKANYGAIFLAITIFSIISNPSLLICLVVLGGAWGYLMIIRPRSEDGSLVPATIGSRTLSGFEQKAALAGITIVVLLVTSLGSTIFWALGVSCVAIGLHAVLHSTEFHEVDAEEFAASAPRGGGAV